MSEVKMPTSIDLPSNSINAKAPKEPERPKVKKIVQGKVITKKRSLGKRFADTFLGEAAGNVRDYVIQEVLIPTIKDTIGDVIVGTTEMILFGKRRRGYRTSASSSAYTPYNAYSKPNYPQKTSRPTSRYYVEDIIFQTRPEAENVLSNMVDMIKDFGAVSVSDLYEMVGIDGVYTDNSWGWTDLGTADVRRVSEGYMLMLPRVECVK